MIKLLDLFCGAGGTSVGYYNAGFSVTGVDIVDQHNYPFTFIQDDALEYIKKFGDDYDVIHASPPCQGYGVNITRSNGKAPRLIKVVRTLLSEIGKPYIIENVEGAPLIKCIKLCGQMFQLNILRHRLFESNIKLIAPTHPIHPKHSYFTVVGHERGTYKEWCDAMGITWMTRKELTQAIPPAYTEYVGKQVIEKIG